MTDLPLTEKIALITGANQGIGAATALALADKGASVVITYLGEPDDPKAGNLVRTITEDGGNAAAIAVDLADSANISPLFDFAQDTFGTVDILVNNAAHSTRDDIYTITPSEIDQHYAVNVRAMILTCQEFARRWKSRLGGRIINLSSGVVDGAPNELAYSASKGAIEALTRGLAKALAPKAITVNAVSPGPTDTGWLTPELSKQLAVQTPLQRIGQPEDIADIIVFLASEQARWLTGQIIDAGGGWHMRF